VGPGAVGILTLEQGNINSEEERRRRSEGQRSEGSAPYLDARYDTGSAVQILGSGKLTGEESQYLTADEQRELARP
jgi:hypothetical protein